MIFTEKKKKNTSCNTNLSKKHFLSADTSIAFTPLTTYVVETMKTCIFIHSETRRGGSNEYPQFMFFSRNTKNNVYPCKPQFYYIKVGFKGVKII